jgi:deazaflavin-dependent oxidoreductase (nitroreductase family)
VDDAEVIEEFRANGGRVGGALADTPILLLHHIGARSGLEARDAARLHPARGRLPDRRFQRRGAGPPGWYYNLKVHPTVEIEVGAQTLSVQAEELEGAARQALWPKLLAASTSLADYQAKTRRTIPLFRLTRQR